jgi:uncharacterized protein (DUF1697 family)
MYTYIAMLRAVNVGGTGKLSMAAFRKLLEDLGYLRVETYIQSGNAVFDAVCSAKLARFAIATGLEELMGRPVGALVRTHKELTQVIEANPFADEAAARGASVFAVFLSAVPDKAATAGLAAIPLGGDRYSLVGDTLYMHLRSAAETKFTAKAVERILGVTTTARNWNTVLKLHAMSQR